MRNLRFLLEQTIGIDWIHEPIKGVAHILKILIDFANLVGWVEGIGKIVGDQTLRCVEGVILGNCNGFTMDYIAC
jgi:hypothetical protein